MYNDEPDLVFEWDDDNRSHISRHGISPDEAEYVLTHDPVDGGSQNHEGEERFIQIGITATMRVLVVIVTWRENRIRVVTAYRAPPSVRTFYFSERKR